MSYRMSYRTSYRMSRTSAFAEILNWVDTDSTHNLASTLSMPSTHTLSDIHEVSSIDASLSPSSHLYHRYSRLAGAFHPTILAIEFDWSCLDELDDQLLESPVTSFLEMCYEEAVSDDEMFLSEQLSDSGRATPTPSYSPVEETQGYKDSGAFSSDESDADTDECKTCDDGEELWYPTRKSRDLIDAHPVGDFAHVCSLISLSLGFPRDYPSLDFCHNLIRFHTNNVIGSSQMQVEILDDVEDFAFSTPTIRPPSFHFYDKEKGMSSFMLMAPQFSSAIVAGIHKPQEAVGNFPVPKQKSNRFANFVSHLPGRLGRSTGGAAFAMA